MNDARHYTCCAALRCQTKEGEVFQAKETQKKQVQGKNKQKSRLQKHPEQQEEQSSSILMDSTAYPCVQEQPNSLQVKSTIEIGSCCDKENENLDDDIDILLQDLFSNKESPLSTMNGEKVIENH